MSMSADHGGDDPWMLREGMADPAQAAASGLPVLRVETIKNVEPLDAQLGAFPKKTVPDLLYDALFGQPELTEAEIEAAGGNRAAVQTYAILEAARVVNLPERLEDSGLEHRCLFKGRAYDELKDVAPWIVRLEEGNSFTRNLFTRSDAYWHLWDNEPGIYARSRRSMDDLWRHFRKFTMLYSKQSKSWHYFRFYSSEALRGIVAHFDPRQFDDFAGPCHALIGRAANGGMICIMPASGSAQSEVVQRGSQ